MTTNRKHQAGFTIIELTIATAVFSVILLVIAAGIISFTKSYLKGVHQSQTQETARTVQSELTQALQFASRFQPVISDPTVQVYCLGTVKYTFRLNQRFVSSSLAINDHAIVRSPFKTGDICEVKDFDATVDTELLGSGMWLQSSVPGAQVIQDLGNNNYQINLNVAYGEIDQVNPDTGYCNSGAGSEYCATAKLTSFIQRRL